MSMACHIAASQIAEGLDMPTLLAFGVAGRTQHFAATRIADERTRRSFGGIYPVLGAEHGPYWKRMGEALKPRRLYMQYNGMSPDCTRLFGSALSTKGPWFVEFEVTAAKATNGTPCVGLVDAASRITPKELESGMVPRDMSRKGQGDLAVAFSPETGRVFACGVQGHVREGGCCAAWLNWKALGDSSMPWNTPIKAGLLVRNGKLTLYRGNVWGDWRSSGVVMEDLPKQVIPAVFLSSFVGYASVRFLNMWAEPPDVVCPDCDRLGHGLSDWYTWPLPAEHQ